MAERATANARSGKKSAKKGSGDSAPPKSAAPPTEQKESAAPRKENGTKAVPTEITLTAGAPAPAPTRPERSDEELMRVLLEDPTKVLDESEISEDEALRLQRLANPYSFVDRSAGGAVVGSVTNMRADYITKFSMTTLIAFLYQMHHEYEVPAEARRWLQRAKNVGNNAALRAFTSSELEIVTGALSKRVAELKEAEKAQAHARAVYDAAKVNAAADDIAKMPPTKTPGAKAPAAKKPSIASIGDKLFKSVEIDGVHATPNIPLATPNVPLAAALAAKEEAEKRAAVLLYVAGEELAKVGSKTEARLPATAASIADVPEVGAFLKAHGKIRADDRAQLEVPADVAKEIIRGFLSAYLEFDPAHHVRSAHDEATIAKSLEAKAPDAPRRDAADPERPTIEELRARPPPSSALPESDRAALRVLTATERNRRAASAALDDTDLGAALSVLAARREAFRPYLVPVPADSPAAAALDHIPPQDTFHRLRFFADVNYEALRRVTAALYHDKPELELAVGIWKILKGESPEALKKDFADYCQAHEDEFRSEPLQLDVGAWTLAGSWKENRERIEYYNKHTEVLKRIMDRHADDAKLGAELMKKRVLKEKAKNIREAGPDPPGLKEYQKQAGGLAGMGVEKGVSAEEMRRLEAARGDLKVAQELKHHDELAAKVAEFERIAQSRPLTPEEKRDQADAAKALKLAKEMLEVPDDAVQVDVFTHDAKTGKMTKKAIYTKAEAPEELAAERKERLAQTTSAALHPLALKTGAGAPNERKTALAPHALRELAKEQETTMATRHAAALKDSGGPAPVSAAHPGLGLGASAPKKQAKATV